MTVCDQRGAHHPPAQPTDHRTQSPRQQLVPDSISNVAQLLRRVPHHLLLGQQHSGQPQRGDNSVENLNDFINKMKPSQRSIGATTSHEYFICLTEQERLFYQEHQTLGQRPFDKEWQHQKPRLHKDAVSPSTTSCTSHQRHHQTHQLTCPTAPTVQSSTSTTSSWFHQVKQCGAGTTGGPATSSWSHQTTSFRCRQHQHGEFSTASSWALHRTSCPL